MTEPVTFLNEDDKVNENNYKTCYSEYIETCKPYASDKNNYCEQIGMGIQNYVFSDPSNSATKAMGKCLAHPLCDVQFSDENKCVSRTPNNYPDYCNDNENEKACNENDCVFKTVKVPACVEKD